MTQFTIRQPAGEHTRFLPGAFDCNIGKVIPVNLPNGDVAQGKIVSIDIPDHGDYADITVDTDVHPALLQLLSIEEI